MEKFSANRKQFILIGLLVLSFFLLMDLNSRLGDLFRLTQIRDQYTTEVAALEATEMILVTKIAHATSQAALDEWSRLQKQGQPGDIPIVPLTAPNVTSQPKVLPTPTVRPIQHWERWWALFFGK